MVLVLILRAVLVDIDFLYLFAHRDVEELDLVVHSTGGEQQVVDLREGEASARLARVGVEDELSAGLSGLCLRLGEDTLRVPNDDHAVLVGRGKDVPLDD